MTEHLTGIVDSITALSKQRDAANEEIRRLRDLCREAHYTLYDLHSERRCFACDDLRTGARSDPCPALAALRRLEMAGGWEPPRG